MEPAIKLGQGEYQRGKYGTCDACRASVATLYHYRRLDRSHVWLCELCAAGKPVSPSLPEQSDVVVETHEFGPPRDWFARIGLRDIRGHCVHCESLADVDEVLTKLTAFRARLVAAIKQHAETPAAVDGAVDALMRELGPEAVR